MKLIISLLFFLLMSCEQISKDEVIDYIDAVSFYDGGYIDLKFGGSHSYDSFSEKLDTIKKFLNL